MEELIAKDEVYQIVGAAMEVHSCLGRGFLEPVYQEALAIEFDLRHIPYVSQVGVQIAYKGRVLEKEYIPDFICFGSIIVELKALNMLTTKEEAQILNYLKASKHEVGLLLNFGAESLQWKRKVLSKLSLKYNSRNSRN
jgi:GxxExxY protein